jgi:hypothetical protein
MTGGLLQLVAKGINDLFLMGDPEITFFKVVYRRHTNFSIKDISLQFNNRMDFGKSGVCPLQSRGDMLHNLLLEITLPHIDIKYKKVTKYEIFQLLKTYGINWDSGIINPNDLVTSNDIININSLIDAYVTELQAQSDELTDILQSINDYNTNNHNNSNSDYNAGLIQLLLDNDPNYKDIYGAIKQFGDNYSHHRLSNSDEIKRFILNQFKDFIFDDPEIENNDVKESFINNFRFYDNIQRTNLLVTKSIEGSISTDVYFKQIINDLYINETSYDYKRLDAYKIFDQYLTNNKKSITELSDVEVIRSLVGENINWGIGKNIQLMMRIYDNFKNNYQFVFYKRLQYDSETQTYNTGEPFLNVSTLTTIAFNDNFTNKLTILDGLNQPDGIVHEYSNYVTEKINAFHLNNRDYFRKALFQEYFSNVNLWSKLEIKNFVNITSSTIQGRLKNVYLLNLLPLAILNDIQLLMGNIIPSLDNSIYNTDRLVLFFNNYIGVSGGSEDHMVDFKDNVTNSLMNDDFKLVSNSDLNILSDLGKAYKTVPEDVLITAIFVNYPPFDPEDGGEKTDVLNYVIRKWIKKIDDLVVIYNATYTSNLMTNTDKQVFIDLINTFYTSYQSLPLYNVYKNKFNIFELSQDNNNSQFIENPLNITTSTNRYLDASSSIWNYLFNSLIASYNDFFNNEIFNKDYYENMLGQSALEDLIEIQNNKFDLENNSHEVIQEYSYGDNIDYYNLYVDAIDNITNYLDTRRLSYIRMNERYNLYKYILQIIQVKINRRDNYYGRVQTIINLINDGLTEMYNNLNLNLGPPPEIVNTTLSLVINGGTTIKGDTIDPQISSFDFFDLLRNDTNIMECFDTDYENDLRYQQTIGLTPTLLFKDVSNILNNFNDFDNTSDILNYLLNIIIKLSSVSNQSFLKSTNIDSYNATIAYFTARKNVIDEKLLSIKNGDNEILKDQISGAGKMGKNAKFSWVNRLGHALIQEYTIKIGGQIMFSGTGDWLEINKSLNTVQGQQRGYCQMIGDTLDLNSFNNDIKTSKVLYVPLPVWFSEDIGNSLPMVSLSHTNVELEIKFNNFNKVAKWETLTQFRSTPRLKARVLAQYIYVEDDERKRIATQKHEYLITQLQINNNIQITPEMINQEDNTYSHRIYFENLAKQIVWIFQDRDSLDESNPQNQYPWNNYLYNINGISHKIYTGVKIEFNQQYREETRDNIYYNYVTPWKHHKSTPSDGVGVYSFALFPDQLQPSGVANLSRIDNFTLIFTINPIVVSHMIEFKKSLNLKIFVPSYNILRIMSGMAGLAFFSS